MVIDNNISFFNFTICFLFLHNLTLLEPPQLAYLTITNQILFSRTWINKLVQHFLNVPTFYNRNQNRILLEPDRLIPLSTSALEWTRQSQILRGILIIVEQLFKKIETADSLEKLNWLVPWVKLDICDK